MSTDEPGGNASFGALKQIDAGVLDVEYAEAGPRTVPTITLEGDANGAPHSDASAYAKKFSGTYAHRIIEGGVGHNLPREAPRAFAEAIVDVAGYVT